MLDPHENRRFLIAMMVLAMMGATTLIMAMTTGTSEPDWFPVESAE